MARPKEFDREQALERAMQVSWGKGYAATSLAELLEAMGIRRQSMYGTFGSRRALFDEALARYMGRADPQRACLATAPSPRRAIRELFERILDERLATRRKLGHEQDSRGLARFLVGARHGLRVAATADPGPPGLRDIARIALAALD